MIGGYDQHWTTIGSFAGNLIMLQSISGSAGATITSLGIVAIL
jgi:hypothetical protein